MATGLMCTNTTLPAIKGEPKQTSPSTLPVEYQDLFHSGYAVDVVHTVNTQITSTKRICNALITGMFLSWIVEPKSTSSIPSHSCKNPQASGLDNFLMMSKVPYLSIRSSHSKILTPLRFGRIVFVLLPLFLNCFCGPWLHCVDLHANSLLSLGKPTNTISHSFHNHLHIH